MQKRIIQIIESKKALILIASIMVIVACLNIHRKLSVEIPDDGVIWRQKSSGEFLQVEGFAASNKVKGIIKEGDILLSIEGNSIHKLTDLTKALWQHKNGDVLTYKIMRNKAIMDINVPIGKKQVFFYIYLCIVGFAVLAFGVFILLKGKNERLARSFFWTMLLLFSVYTISHVGIFDIWDWLLYWLDEIALLALPLSFIGLILLLGNENLKYQNKIYSSKKIFLIPLFLLLSKASILMSGILGVIDINSRAYSIIYGFSERIDLFYLLSGIAIGIALLIISYRRSHDIVQRNQLKFILAGLGAGFGLFVIFGSFYLMFGFPMKALELSTLTQVFIPITFTYSLLKYKLMDVDIIIKRGIIYTITTLIIIAVYVGVMLASLYIFGKGSTASLIMSGTISTIFAFIMFSPLRQRVKEFINKQYYKDSYNYREMLASLLKSISRQPDIIELSKELVPMIAYTFQINKIAFYVMQGNKLSLLNSIGLDDGTAKSLELTEEEIIYLSKHNRIDLGDEKYTRIKYKFIDYFLSNNFFYLYPCVYKSNINGMIAVSKKVSNELLSSEDESLLIYVANDFAIAIEISRLVLELSQKANEFERLKNFNENLLQSLNLGILYFDNGNKITFCNDCFLKIFELKREEVINKDLMQILPAKLTNSIQELINNAYEPEAEGKQQQLYKIHLPVREKELIVNISIVKMKADKINMGGNILIIEDITSQAYLEDQLIHAERLSSIGLMAAGIAHEVNTPLTGIASYADMLSKIIKEKKAKTILDKIQEQAFRASNIVGNLLNLSRRQSLPAVLLDLHDVINESIKLLKPHFKDTNITIKKDFGIDNFMIKGNEAKLQQLIMNLLLNARDAMPNGGNIYIKTWSADGLNYLSIEDEGKGIPASIQDKIFDPFFTTKSPSKGTGLGLSLCYNIVKEHAGSINFKSTEGRGTIFIINFVDERLKHDRKRALINS